MSYGFYRTPSTNGANAQYTQFNPSSPQAGSPLTSSLSPSPSSYYTTSYVQRSNDSPFGSTPMSPARPAPPPGAVERLNWPGDDQFYPARSFSADDFYRKVPGVPSSSPRTNVGWSSGLTSPASSNGYYSPSDSISTASMSPMPSMASRMGAVTATNGGAANFYSRAVSSSLPTADPMLPLAPMAPTNEQHVSQSVPHFVRPPLPPSIPAVPSANPILPPPLPPKPPLSPPRPPVPALPPMPASYLPLQPPPIPPPPPPPLPPTLPPSTQIPAYDVSFSPGSSRSSSPPPVPPQYAYQPAPGQTSWVPPPEKWSSPMYDAKPEFNEPQSSSMNGGGYGYEHDEEEELRLAILASQESHRLAQQKNEQLLLQEMQEANALAGYHDELIVREDADYDDDFDNLTPFQHEFAKDPKRPLPESSAPSSSQYAGEAVQEDEEEMMRRVQELSLRAAKDEAEQWRLRGNYGAEQDEDGWETYDAQAFESSQAGQLSHSTRPPSNPPSADHQDTLLAPIRPPPRVSSLTPVPPPIPVSPPSPASESTEPVVFPVPHPSAPPPFEATPSENVVSSLPSPLPSPRSSQHQWSESPAPPSDYFSLPPHNPSQPHLPAYDTYSSPSRRTTEQVVIPPNSVLTSQSEYTQGSNGYDEQTHSLPSPVSLVGHSSIPQYQHSPVSSPGWFAGGEDGMLAPGYTPPSQLTVLAPVNHPSSPRAPSPSSLTVPVATPSWSGHSPPSSPPYLAYLQVEEPHEVAPVALQNVPTQSPILVTEALPPEPALVPGSTLNADGAATYGLANDRAEKRGRANTALSGVESGTQTPREEQASTLSPLMSPSQHTPPLSVSPEPIITGRLPSPEFAPSSSTSSAALSPPSFPSGSNRPDLHSGRSYLGDLMAGVSFGFGRATAVPRSHMGDARHPFPDVISLGPKDAFWIAAPNFRQLLRLLANLGHGSIEHVDQERYNTSASSSANGGTPTAMGPCLRPTLQFWKGLPTEDFYTVLWFELDTPVPSYRAPSSASRDTSARGFGSVLPDSVQHAPARGSHLFVCQAPLPPLPRKLPEIATYLQGLVASSRSSSVSSDANGLKRLGKLVDKFYEADTVDYETGAEAAGGAGPIGAGTRRKTGGILSNLMHMHRRGDKRGKKNGSTDMNGEAFDLVTPFRLDS